MRQMYKGFAVGLALVIIAMVPACRTTKKDQTKTSTATQTFVTDQIPTMTSAERPVEQPRDFVTETVATATREPLPSDIDQLNRVVQTRGYLRDAFFAYDESTLPNDAQAALTSSATWLRNNPLYYVLIEGHCDERGTEQYNLALGDRRAAIARDYLITLGVDAGHIRTVSYGEERPFEESHTESAWAQNRRAHLVLVGR